MAREQDQAVIREYMLSAINSGASEELIRKRVETGLNRLIALEHELLTVKAELDAKNNPQENAKTHSTKLKNLAKKAVRRMKG